MIQHPNPLKQIIDDIKLRLDDLETETKSIKWSVVQAMQIAEQNEQAIDTISRILQQDPKAMRKPVNKGGRPKLAIKRAKND